MTADETQLRSSLFRVVFKKHPVTGSRISLIGAATDAFEYEIYKYTHL